jgi:4-amino-4-deoxy-L-arabinose transferase-like glycosyltransferase
MDTRVQTDPRLRKGRLSQTAVLWLLVMVLLISFGLRVYRLGDQSVWWDEGYSTWLARQSFVEIAQGTSRDTHPPLYFWLLHLWREGSSDREFGLRFLSAGVGLLTVAVAYCLGRAVGNRLVGLLAALLVGISPFHIWWSQEVRMYAPAALLATLALWAALRVWDRGRLVDWVLYVLFTTAGLYTLYLNVLVLMVINLAWLWVFWCSERRRSTLIRWMSAQVVALLLFAPWLIYAVGRVPIWSAATPVSSDVFVKIYWTVLTAGIPVNVERYGWLTIPVLVIFIAGLVALLWTGWRDPRLGRNGTLLLLCLLFPTGVVYLLSLPREAFFYTPPIAPRYLVIFAPAFYVLVAWGMDRLGEGRRWLVGVLAMATFVGVAVYGLWQYYPARVLEDDYKAVESTLQAYGGAGDGVVLYTDRDWPIFDYHHLGAWLGIPNGQRMTPETADHYLAPVWDEHDGIWLVVTPYATINDPQGEIPAWLEARASRIVEHRFVDKVLRFYARTEDRADAADELAPDSGPARSLSVDVAPGLRLAGYEQAVREYRSGDTIHLFLYWEPDRGSAAKADGLEVSLVGEQGDVWQRVEIPWPTAPEGGGTVREQVDLVVAPDAPDGAYTFAVRATSGGETFRFGQATVRQQEYASVRPSDVVIGHPLQTDFGDGVRLLGYDLAAEELEAGGTVDLTLYWQARQSIGQRYKVFTHVLGEVFNPATGNSLWGQQDNEPVGGARATSSWRMGEVIVDEYGIALDPGIPSGRYAIEIGLYEPATGERLSVLDGDGDAVADHLILAYVQVGRD